MGLYQYLQQYVMNRIVPMHMPGHKRNPAFTMVNPYAIDITEVEGMDDLHNPTGVIRQLMNRFREYYETKDTYLCLNGSTSANMIAIACACRHGDVIVTDANAHRSVTHAVDLLGLKSVRVVRPDLAYRAKPGLPESHPSDGTDTPTDAHIPGPVRPEDVKDMFHHLATAGRPPAAIVVTSPTYEGVVSDIQAIADIVHPYGTVLIVDAAHGAHLTLAARTAGCSMNWPKPPTTMDADFVVESMHTTLPALTPAALLHRCSDRIDDATVMHWHDVFITSSPSYVLMSSMDQCLSWLEGPGIKAFRLYDERLRLIYEAAEKTRVRADGVHRSGMNLLGPENRDPSKLVIVGDGERAATALRGNGIEPERVEKSHVILMTSPADTVENLERVTALALS